MDGVNRQGIVPSMQESLTRPVINGEQPLIGNNQATQDSTDTLLIRTGDQNRWRN